jgi:hypothetical protein
VQIELAGEQFTAGARPGRDARKAPVLAIELRKLAAQGEAGQLLEEKPALAAATEAQFADQLLVSGLLSRRGGNARHQFAIGHTPRLRQRHGSATGRTQESAVCRRMWETPNLGKRMKRIVRLSAARRLLRASQGAASEVFNFGLKPLALPRHPPS